MLGQSGISASTAEAKGEDRGHGLLVICDQAFASRKEVENAGGECRDLLHAQPVQVSLRRKRGITASD